MTRGDWSGELMGSFSSECVVIRVCLLSAIGSLCRWLNAPEKSNFIQNNTQH